MRHFGEIALSRRADMRFGRIIGHCRPATEGSEGEGEPTPLNRADWRRWIEVGAAVGLGLLLWPACHGGGGSHVGAQARPDGTFSGRAALSDASQLVERTSAAMRKASDPDSPFFWIRDQLEDFGSEVGSPDPDGALIGVLPGQSPDVFMLAATCCGSAESSVTSVSTESVSGAAVLLELGRALSRRPRPFTIWLVFLPTPNASAPLAKEAQALSARLATKSLRLAVFFESLAWPDLTVVRDLHSHGVYRDAFWESARALGLEAVFASDAPFGSQPRAHPLVLEPEFRAVLALVGESRSQGSGGRTQMQGLEEFGTVVLHALERMAERLQSIDQFRQTPATRPAFSSESLDSTD